MAGGQEIDQAAATGSASTPTQRTTTPASVSVPTTQAAVPGRVEFVDSVRALAALYVVVHHLDLTIYGWQPNTGPAFLTPLLYGHFGVAVFIVVSGFSLGLAPARNGWRLGRGGYWTFMRRRAWRILPPYWAALAVSVALGILLSTRINDPVSWKGVATHFLLVQNQVEGKTPNIAFWSIAVEWQLYWIFPLLLLMRRRLGPIVLMAAALTTAVALGIAHDHVGGAVVNKLLSLSPALGALFVLGLVAATVVSRPAAAGRRWWGGIAVVSGIAAVIATLYVRPDGTEFNFYWLDLVVGVATAAGLAYLTATPTSRFRRALEWRPLMTVGRFSYSIYLIHAPLLMLGWVFLVKPLGLASGPAFALMAAVVVPTIVASSYAFYLVAERPFMKYRSWAELRAAWQAGWFPRWREETVLAKRRTADETA